MACGPGGQQGCVGGSSYLGVHVNQRACLLRAGELRGKGSVSPASSEETRLASWLRAQIRQSGQKGTVCVQRREKGKTSVYWLTVQVVAEFREKMERNVPTVVKLNILQNSKASQYFKGAKITKWPSHTVSAGRLWELLINVKDLMILRAGAEKTHFACTLNKKLAAWWISWHSQSPSRPFTAARRRDDGAPTRVINVPAMKDFGFFSS